MKIRAHQSCPHTFWKVESEVDGPSPWNIKLLAQSIMITNLKQKNIYYCNIMSLDWKCKTNSLFVDKNNYFPPFFLFKLQIVIKDGRFDFWPANHLWDKKMWKYNFSIANILEHNLFEFKNAITIFKSSKLIILDPYTIHHFYRKVVLDLL